MPPSPVLLKMVYVLKLGYFNIFAARKFGQITGNGQKRVLACSSSYSFGNVSRLSGLVAFCLADEVQVRTRFDSFFDAAFAFCLLFFASSFWQT